MVRVITQETFNSVVKENMEEFEMGKEEAIKEAKDQFETQVCTLIGKYKIKLTNDGGSSCRSLCFYHIRL